MNIRLKPGIVYLSTCVMIAIGMSSVGISQVTTMEKENDLLGVLKSDSPPGDKAIACKRLAIYGTAEAAPELAKLLSNEQLAAWARIALEAIPGTKVDETLRKSTESLKGRLLVGTINSIGVRRDASAVETMSTLLQDKDEDVASAAAVALGRIGNAAATKTLRQSIASSPAKVRSAVAEGCVLCAERAMQGGDATLAAAIYDDVRKAQVPKQRIVEATRGAILARKNDGIPLLVESLRSKERELFQIAITTAREMSGREVDGVLASELSVTSPEKAALVIQALADRKNSVALPAIAKAAAAGPKQVRLSAINALGRVGDASCVASLLGIANEADEELTDAALTALAELPDPTINAEIIARIPKAEGKVLAALIGALGQRRIEATQELVVALSNADKSVRAAALKSLGTTVPATSLDVLVSQVVLPGFAEDFDAAKQALKTAAVRMPDREACAAQLVQAMNAASLPSKIAMLDILGAVGGTKSLEAMSSALKSDESQLRDAGSRLLGDWMTIDAAPVLLDSFKNGPTDKFQARLFKGYLRMARQFEKNPQERVAMCRKAFEAAPQPSEQKLVLELVKLFPDIETLKLAIQATKVTELKEDALQTAQTIAQKIKGNTEEVQKLLTEAGIANIKP